MAQIIDLDALLPDDITIKVAGQQLKLPGDIDVEQVFRLFELYAALGKLEGTEQEIFEQMRERFGDIQAELLALFQIRQPKLEKLPLGVRGIGAMLRVVLEQLGLKITDAAGPENPTPRKTTPKKAARRKS